MMVWPSWLWLTSPFKWALWIFNRLATWTGLFFFWKRFRAQRHFWLWIIFINAVSMGVLALVFFWLHARLDR